MTDNSRDLSRTASDTSLAGSSKADIELMLVDAEQAVTRLRAELDRRRADGEWDERLAAQHAEIARLAEHLENAKVDWPAVREFFADAVREMNRGTGDERRES